MTKCLIHDVFFDMSPVWSIFEFPSKVESLSWSSCLSDFGLFKLSFKFFTLIVVFRGGIIEWANEEGSRVEIAHPAIRLFRFTVFNGLMVWFHIENSNKLQYWFNQMQILKFYRSTWPSDLVFSELLLFAKK